METLFNFLNSIFALRARQGWILLLVCGIGLIFNQYGIGPFGSIDSGWIVSLGIGLVSGVSILLVCLVEWLLKVSRDIANRNEFAETQIENHRALEREAVENLPLLDRSERIALAYIFNIGNQRFRGEARYNVLSSLASKQMIGTPVNSTAHDVWIVRDSIWQMRDRLLSQWGGSIYVPNKAPWELL
jgi:hypothetical protein